MSQITSPLKRFNPKDVSVGASFGSNLSISAGAAAPPSAIPVEYNGDEDLTEKTVRLQFLLSEKLGELPRGKILEWSPDAETIDQLPQGAVLTKIAVKGIRSDFPYPMHVTFPSHEAENTLLDKSGKRFHLFCWSGEKPTQEERVIFCDKEPLSNRLFKQYGHITDEILRSGIIPAREDMLLVPENHDVIVIIRKNADYYGPLPEVQSIPRVGCVYPVPTDLYNRVVDDVTEKVIKNFKTTDLNTFKVLLSRPGCLDMNNLEGSAWDHAEDYERKRLLSKRVSVGFELILSYVTSVAKEGVATAQSAYKPYMKQ